MIADIIEIASEPKLDADYSRYGVKVACRFTATALNPLKQRKQINLKRLQVL